METADLNLTIDHKEIKGKFVGIDAYNKLIYEHDLALSRLKSAGVSLEDNEDIVKLNKVLEIIDSYEELIFAHGLNFDNFEEMREEIINLRNQSV